MTTRKWVYTYLRVATLEASRLYFRELEDCMYDVIRGPLMWGSLIVCFTGVLYRFCQVYRQTRPRELAYVARPPEAGTAPAAAGDAGFERIARFQASMPGRHPVMTLVSVVFHFCLFVVPVFLLAHNLIVRETLGFCLPAVPDRLADALTVVFLACCLFFLVRRLAVPVVAAISSFSDYLLLFVTAAPFLTGFMAFHQIFPYRQVMLLHMLSGELMLVLLPFTKLGHMVFFFIARYLVAGEYALGKGSRTWKVECQ